MNYELMENNKVFLKGEVISEPIFSHEVFGEGFYELNLNVWQHEQQDLHAPLLVEATNPMRPNPQNTAICGNRCAPSFVANNAN